MVKSLSIVLLLASQGALWITSAPRHRAQASALLMTKYNAFYRMRVGRLQLGPGWQVFHFTKKTR
ncbi:hypothetical protein [Massilia sp. TWP1-3-3]|uniref:hypothetical protein n=1 Tax=Massilia sp. TWP1-3-3 TaxID=2804573 RepID=UPI003CF1DD13